MLTNKEYENKDYDYCALLIKSVCCAQDVTLTSIQAEFQQKVLSLVPETDRSQEELNEKIPIFGQETFGNHPARQYTLQPRHQRQGRMQ